MLIERIRKHVADGFPNDDFTASSKEILLYIDQALAQQIKASSYEGAKMEGFLMVPEAYLVTLNISPLTQDDITGEWVATLPQPPLGLPLGYSINTVYFADSANGVSQPVFLIKAKRFSFRSFMPTPTGVSARIENNTIRLRASNNQPLINQNLYVQMPISRTSDVNAPMNMPDDAIENIFNDAVMQLTKRYAEPKDIIRDELPSGNKSS